MAAAGGLLARTTGYAVESASAARITTPSTNPTSASRVTRNAFSAARRADSLRLQWPMRR
jgi:hypothetical protein